ncbi:hypothetical protein EIP86_010005 [Pleurotus ostreatoroseus]|nr:hypothetical protein EIP86_010005 [Pleurotus ostreatoroseus]
MSGSIIEHENQYLDQPLLPLSEVVPLWLLKTLSKAFPEDTARATRYESYRYPALNTLLGRVFPANEESRWIIGPQLSIIKSVPEIDPDTSIMAVDGIYLWLLIPMDHLQSDSEPEDDLDLDIELDQFREYVYGRSSGRLPSGTMIIPDFVGCKVPANLTKDYECLCFVMEVKRSNKDLGESQAQIQKYLDVIAGKIDGSIHRGFKALLVLTRSRTQVWGWNDQWQPVKIETVTTYPVPEERSCVVVLQEVEIECRDYEG